MNRSLKNSGHPISQHCSEMEATYGIKVLAQIILTYIHYSMHINNISSTVVADMVK